MHYQFYLGIVVGITMVSAMAIYLSGESGAGFTVETIEKITLKQRSRCPFCGHGGYSFINRRKPDDLISCSNNDCPIHGIEMTVSAWENRTYTGL